MEYRTKGVCSRMIKLELDGDTIRSVEFVGGCSGNTQGVARLVEGMKVDDAIARIEGIKCGPRPTSCPDQLAQALRQATGKLKFQIILYIFINQAKKIAHLCTKCIF